MPLKLGQGVFITGQENRAEKMPKMARILQIWVAIALMFALALAPAFDAVKHGPAAFLTELEHATHHSATEKNHSHHDIDDHDHTVVVILPAGLAYSVQFVGDILRGNPDHVSDALIQLPRRPPRA